MSDIERKLGQRVAKLRKDAHLTQAELAERLDVETETVSRWERGQNTAGLEQLKDLAHVLGVELWELLRFGEAEPVKPRAATDLDRAIERLTKVVRRQPPAFVDAVAAVAKVLSSRWPMAPARLPRKAPARNPAGSPGALLPGR